jgi:hypothetical protein
MTRTIRHLFVAAAAVIALSAASASGTLATSLSPTPPAGADCQTSSAGTVCTWSETFATPFPVPYGVSCGSFAVRVNLSGERRVIAFYGATGLLERRIRHASYEGALINSATGASVPHVGAFTIVDDFGAGTSTITGMLSRTVVNGEGVIWRNIGRLVVSLSNGALLFEAGEHGTWDVVTDASVAAELCGALG